MVTIEQIEKNILNRAKPRLDELEKVIDAQLEEAWERGETSKISVNLPTMTPRIIVDELARRYRAGNSWDVDLACQSPSDKSANRYNVLVFSRYVRSSGSWRD